MRIARGAREFIAFCAAVLFLCFGGDAKAQSCNFTIDNIDFGQIDLTLGNRFRTTGNLNITCTGIPGQRVRICPNIGDGTGGGAASGDPRFMLRGADQLQFNLFRNGAYTTVWGSFFWGKPPRPPQPRVRLNAAGVGSRTRRMRYEIYAGQTTLPAGTYSTSFAGGHTLISYAYNSVGNCAAIGAMNGVQVPFTVQATNTGSCTVSATTLDFGNQGVLDASVDATNTIDIVCTQDAAYTIGLDGGLSGATDPELRKMTRATEEITYAIYSDSARTAPWGDTIGTNTVSGVGNGSTQSYTGYGRVPAQTTPSPGDYTDTIVVTVTY